MYHKRTKRLVELCPQCYKSVDSSVYRLVQDACGHFKCRICLLQEASGCLICEVQQKNLQLNPLSVDARPTEPPTSITPGTMTVDKTTEELQPVRKSVITSLASQLEELSKEKTPSPPCSPIDKETCLMLKQRFEDDILFPTAIAKRSTGNFYHLKRVFSERFFNDEDKNKDKESEHNDKNEESVSGSETVDERINSDKQVEEHNTKKSDNFKCKVCGKEFQSNGRLNKHFFIHNRTSKFKCDICDKIFKDNYALNCHKRTHTLEKPFSCKYCNKSFSELNNLKRHDKQHRNEKNYACDLCGCKFFTRYDLNRHLAKHSNEKAYSCTICTKQFKFKKCLTRHLVTHSNNTTSFMCELCDSVFKRKDNLKRHIKTAHIDDEVNESDETQHTSDNLLHWKRRSVQNFSQNMPSVINV